MTKISIIRGADPAPAPKPPAPAKPAPSRPAKPATPGPAQPKPAPLKRPGTSPCPAEPFRGPCPIG